jgi:hypothetical protein
MIVPQQVQKTMQGQNAQLDRKGMARFAGLASGDAAGNNDVAQIGSGVPGPRSRVPVSLNTGPWTLDSTEKDNTSVASSFFLYA